MGADVSGPGRLQQDGETARVRRVQPRRVVSPQPAGLRRGYRLALRAVGRIQRRDINPAAMRDPRINGCASGHDGERLKYRPARANVLSEDGWPTAAREFLIDLFKLRATHIWSQAQKKKCLRLEPQALSSLVANLESPDDAAGIAEVVLVAAGAGGKAGQRVERVEICADEIYLRCANGEVTRSE